jgi:hypothetical protein
MKAFVIFLIINQSFLNFLYSQDSTKNVVFNNKSYKIAKPIEYDYFQNSIFKNYSISDFTHTTNLTVEVTHLDLLVPKDLTKNPLINIYSFKALENEIITKKDFDGYKLFWIDALKRGTYDSLSNVIFSDSTIIKTFGKISSKLDGYLILENSEKLLSTLFIIEGGDSKKKNETVVLTNYILINRTVLLIKLSKPYKTNEDLWQINQMSKSYVWNFIRNN